jgi:Domain of unknown function (DUF5666)
MKRARPARSARIGHEREQFTMTGSQSHWRRSVLATTVGVSLAASLALAGVADAATTQSGGGFAPGASGSVAAITGSSMEVQNQQTGQVTVSWTPTTTFSQTASVPASSVAAGDCVTVSGSSSKGTITATTVTVSQPTAGKCTTGGFGGRFGGGASGSSAGGGGTPPSGAAGRRPGGFGGERPGGGAGGGGRPGFGGSDHFGFASGKVTSATSSTLVISGFSSASITKKPSSSKNTKSTKKPPAIKTTTVKVTIKSTTTYSEDQSAASTNLAVGDCVTASGSTSSTGAVTATSVRITSTGGKTCTTGFGRGATGG